AALLRPSPGGDPGDARARRPPAAVGVRERLHPRPRRRARVHAQAGRPRAVAGPRRRARGGRQGAPADTRPPKGVTMFVLMLLLGATAVTLAITLTGRRPAREAVPLALRGGLATMFTMTGITHFVVLRED